MRVFEKSEILMRSDRAEYWQRHIDAWRASGKSGRAYCIEAGVSLSRFYKWRRRLGRAPTETALIPVELAAESGAVRIVIGGEAEIVVAADSSPAAVRIALEGLGLR